MESKRSPRMTQPTQAVLRALLADPTKQMYGSEVCLQASLPSGTIYPILARLEREYGWLESEWEDADISIAEGRPRRRYYRLSADGAQAARIALAGSHQAQQARQTLGKAGPAGAAT